MSFLRSHVQDYLEHRESLGRNHRNETTVLHSLDSFLARQYPSSKKLTAEMFNQWSTTFCHVTPTVRRQRMLIVRKFCLYRSQSYPNSFIPDLLTFPTNNQPETPYIFSDDEISRLLNVIEFLHPCERYPLQSQTFRLALILLYTLGLRRGELIRLKLGDYNQTEKTLLIQETKFYKSRIVPLSSSTVAELEIFLNHRNKLHISDDNTSPILWYQYKCSVGNSRASTVLGNIWAGICSALKIFTKAGVPPPTHHLRHSFAVNVLQRWYQNGEDMQVKLPLLSTFMGHGSIDSTCYYLSFVEGLRSKASLRFEQSFGSLITQTNQGSSNNNLDIALKVKKKIELNKSNHFLML